MNVNDLHSGHPPQRSPAPSKGGLHDFLVDSLRFGPAPTAARERAVQIATVVIVALAMFLLQPPPVLVAIVIAAIALQLVVRLVLGRRRWSRR
ncbi:hypothetical protein GCM10027289_12140 [Tsukamurella serpentis]